MMLPALPAAKSLTGDRGYDSDWFRQALTGKGIKPCIAPKKTRKIQYDYDQALYKKRKRCCDRTFLLGGEAASVTVCLRSSYHYS
jgi:IS5 family transposase